MGYQGHRIFDRFLLTGGSAAIGVAALIGSAAGDGERITGHWASATIDESGQAQVAEVIDYDFGGNDRRGIFRDVPDLDLAAPITVSSATAPDEFIVQDLFDTRIRIGDPDITINGRHRYTIGYPITVGFPNSRLSWNAVGDGWPISIGGIELHMLAGNELTAVECSQGSRRATGGCTAEQVEPGHLVVTVDSLGSMEGVTISAARGAALPAIPTVEVPADGISEDSGTGALLPGALAGSLGLLGGAIASVFVRRAGRESVWAGGAADAAYGNQFGQDDYPTRLVDYSELSEMASIEFAPPRGLAAWQGGVVHAEAVTKDHQVAWLLDRAIAGEVGIAGEGKNLVIHRAPVDSSEADALDELFSGRRSVHLGKYDAEFATGWASLNSRIEAWHKSAPYWDPAGDRRRKIAIGLGIGLSLLGGFAAVGFAVAAARQGPLWLGGVGLGALIGGAGLGLWFRSWELRVRTPQGSGLWILTESFRRFIDQSDAQHVEAAAEQGRLLEYTAWAAALGEVDRWAKSIKEANLSSSVAPQALYLTALAPNLGGATASTATAPSSSGGGGGGGGVGGGGGGGGGGSW